jgi:hypothetical protein
MYIVISIIPNYLLVINSVTGQNSALDGVSVMDLLAPVLETIVTLTALIGGFLGGLVLFGITVSAIQYFRSRKAYSALTFGEVRSVDRFKSTERGHDVPRSVECTTCGVEAGRSTDTFHVTTWRRVLVLAGIRVRTIESGEHYDCLACASGPILASLRAQADDPDDVDAPAPDDEIDGLDELAEDDLDAVIDRLDDGATTEEAVAEVAS